MVKNTPQHSHSHLLENYSTKEMDRDRNDTDSQTRTPKGCLHCIGDFHALRLPVPVLGLDVVGEGLGLLGDRVAVVVVVAVVCRHPR